jgi:DnaJ family protein B protein 13
MSTLKNKNYYEILEIDRTCSQEDISEAYRNLSLKYHPQKATQEKKEVYELHFQKISEAYEVLSDPTKKGIYDIYGPEGLRKGIVDKNGNVKGAYKFLNNGHEIFEKFMGNSNPFMLIRDNEKISEEIPSVFGSAFGGQFVPKEKRLKPIIINLECSLEELYNGCVKTVQYKKNNLNFDSRTTNIVEKTQDVEIFRGYDDKTVITYKEKGNEAPGMVASDLIIKIKELPHKVFRRINKNDLLYMHEISLVKALNSEPVCFYTLDGRKLAISIDEIISPSTVKIVPGEGMPIYDKDLSKCRGDKIKKGDLYIKFNIIFPEYIDPDKKKRIISLLKYDE